MHRVLGSSKTECFVRIETCIVAEPSAHFPFVSLPPSRQHGEHGGIDCNDGPVAELNIAKMATLARQQMEALHVIVQNSKPHSGLTSLTDSRGIGRTIIFKAEEVK